MGLGQSKKASLESHSDFKAVRASRQSSEQSIKSERFVSPPTSPIPGFHSFAPVDGTKTATKTKSFVFKETSVDTQSTAVNQKISFANATELEKRLNQLQRERFSCNSNEVSTSKAQQLRQGKQQQKFQEPTQKQEHKQTTEQQKQKFQQLQQLSQQSLQEKQQQQQYIPQQQQQRFVQLQHQQSQNKSLQQQQQQNQYVQKQQNVLQLQPQNQNTPHQHHAVQQPQFQQQQQLQPQQQSQQQSQRRPMQQKQQQQQMAQKQQPAQQQQLHQCQQEQSSMQALQQNGLKEEKSSKQEQPQQQLELLKQQQSQRNLNLQKQGGQRPAQFQKQPSQQGLQHPQQRHFQHQFQQQQPVQAKQQAKQEQLQQIQCQDLQHDSRTQDDKEHFQESEQQRESQQNQPRLQQDNELHKLSTQSSCLKQQKQPQQHQEENEVQKQGSKEKSDIMEKQQPISDHLDIQQNQQQNYKVHQGQIETLSCQPKQHQQLSQVAQEQQQQQHNQVQNHQSKKAKKQLKREQRLRVLQEQQFGKNTTQHDEQQQTQQEKEREQTEHLANHETHQQPQLNQQIQHLQSKGLKHQEIHKPKVQPEDQKQMFMEQQTKQKQPAQQKQVHKDQQLQQVLTDKTTKKCDQQKGAFAANKKQDKPSIEETVKLDRASTHKSQQGQKSTVQNDCILHVKAQHEKPVPLMTINFTNQKNHKRPLGATPSNAVSPPQTLQPTSISSQLKFQSNQETAINEVSQEIATCKQSNFVPGKKTLRAAANLNSQQILGQTDYLEHAKIKIHDPKKLDTSQQQLLQEQQQQQLQQLQQQQQQQHYQPQLKQEQEEHKSQKLKQNPHRRPHLLQKRVQLRRQQEEQQQQQLAVQSSGSGVLQRRETLNAVHELQPHPPAFAASAAALQAQLALNSPTQPTHTARKHKSVAGDATMEMFKTLQAQDYTATPQTNTNSSGAEIQQSVASWAVVCDKMPDQDFLDKLPGNETSKKERREGQGLFSRIFGRKPKAKSTTKKHQKANEISSSLEELSADLQALKIDPASSIHEMEAVIDIDTDQGCSDTKSQLSSSYDEDESCSAESDESLDPEPPSCIETWEIADDVVEKALCLLPIQVGTVHSRRFTLPDCPFEPELVQRLVSDALEAKRGLKRIKEDQMLLMTFRDCLLKFFEGKEVTDVLPPCNHPPGSNQCNMQPVIQPLVGIIRHVLQEKKAVNEPPKKASLRPTQHRKGQADHGEQRHYIKIKRKLTTAKALQTPTRLLVCFCNACGDSKQPNGQQLFSCGRCQDVVYCSRECQNVDWITHKFTCPGGDRSSYCKHHGT